MLVIPISATPAQSLNSQLGGQNCQINISQKSTGVFLDLAVNGLVLLTAAICRDRVKLVRRPYLGFIGDLAFYDLQGITDPVSTGFGARYVLVYLEATDL